MRGRLLAVGCGGFCLFMMFGGAAATLVGGSPYGGGRPMWPWFVIFGLAALAAFARAIRRGRDDEDLFEGNRGVALALSAVVIVAITGVMTVMFFQPDFWRGLLDGLGR